MFLGGVELSNSGPLLPRHRRRVEMIHGLNPAVHALPCAIMWVQVNEEVDALVQYRKGSSMPLLKAINWQGRRRNFVGTPVVQSDQESLYFEIRDKSTRYAIRFERGRQRWTLEGLDDSWIMGPQDIPRPKYFPPPGSWISEDRDDFMQKDFGEFSPSRLSK